MILSSLCTMYLMIKPSRRPVLVGSDVTSHPRFFALVPELVHVDTGHECNYAAHLS